MWPIVCHHPKIILIAKHLMMDVVFDRIVFGSGSVYQSFFVLSAGVLVWLIASHATVNIIGVLFTWTLLGLRLVVLHMVHQVGVYHGHVGSGWRPWCTPLTTMFLHHCILFLVLVGRPHSHLTWNSCALIVKLIRGSVEAILLQPVDCIMILGQGCGSAVAYAKVWYITLYIMGCFVVLVLLTTI